MKHNFKYYCKDYENIENYDKAAADNFIGWHCHHRKGVNISSKELIALGMYYDRPADELIFLTRSEHRTLHNKGKHHSEEAKKKMSEAAKNRPEEIKMKAREAFKGHKHSEESKKKIGEAQKGKHLSEEAKMKISAAKKGKHPSEEVKNKLSEAWDYDKHFTLETKNKLSEANRGKHWFNNGKINNFCYECPEGFIPGKLSKKYK